MKAAANEVLKGRPLNVEAREFNIDRMTLKRYCSKKKLSPNESSLTTAINKFLQQKMKNVYQVIYYLHQK